MNKPLLQWKREIEKKLNERNYKLNLVEYHFKQQALQSLIDEKKMIINDIKHLKEQLQMIDDIIETANYLEGNILIINVNELVGIRKFKERLIGE